MNLALIGLRGTGKTTVARHLAQRWHWNWLDADVEIERRAGQSIKEIFATAGETVFRDWETAVVRDLAQADQTILALGGGAVVRPENRAALHGRAKVVWLTASPETLWQRMQADTTTAARRPDLTSSGGITEIIALLDARREIYRQCADLEVDTEGKPPERVAAEIADAGLIPSVPR